MGTYVFQVGVNMRRTVRVTADTVDEAKRKAEAKLDRMCAGRGEERPDGGWELRLRKALR